MRLLALKNNNNSFHLWNIYSVPSPDGVPRQDRIHTYYYMVQPSEMVSSAGICSMALLVLSIQRLKSQILKLYLVMKMTLILPRKWPEACNSQVSVGLCAAQCSWRSLYASPEHIQYQETLMYKVKVRNFQDKAQWGPISWINIFKCFLCAWYCAVSHLIPLDNKFIVVSRCIYLQTHLLINKFI